MNEHQNPERLPAKAVGASEAVVRCGVNALRRVRLWRRCPCGHRCAAARPSEVVEPSSWRRAPRCGPWCRAYWPACSADRRCARTKAVRRAAARWSPSRSSLLRKAVRSYSPTQRRTRRPTKVRLRQPAPGGGFSWRRIHSLLVDLGAATNPASESTGAGGETGGAGCRMMGEERVHRVPVSPPVAQGVNAGTPGSIPRWTSVFRPSLETLESSCATTRQSPPMQAFLPPLALRTRSSGGTIRGSPGSSEPGR